MAKKKKFYKKAKPKEQKKKLPINFRKITEVIHSDHLVFVTGLACLIVAIIVVGVDLDSNYELSKQFEREKRESASNLVFWQNEANEKPNYRDAYFSLALIYYQIKDFEKSSENLTKAMSLDPNFDKGKELEVILENY